MPNKFETFPAGSNREVVSENSHEVYGRPVAETSFSEAQAQQSPVESSEHHMDTASLPERQRDLLGGLGIRLEALRADRINTQEMYDLAG